MVHIGRRRFLAHRIAWLLHYGHWPKYTIDHIDGDGTNNKMENLRDVPIGENLKNTRKRKCNNIDDNPYPGVSRRVRRKPWRVKIGVEGKVIYLGSFSTAEEAISAKKDAEKKYGFHPNHGRNQ